MAAYGKIEELQEGSDFLEYVERLEQYFAANEITDDDKKRAIFLTVCGASAYGLLRNLCSPDKPKVKSLDELIALLKAHFNPTPLVIAERFKFWQARQSQTQNVREFLSQLKKMTEFCEFGAFLAEALRDCFVIGIRETTIQKKLLTKATLDLKTALETAVAMEAADRQALELNNHGEVNRISDNNRTYNDHQKVFQKNCFRCGKNNHGHDDCYFREVECYKCKRKGHISRQCGKTREPISERPKKRPSKIHSITAEESSAEDEEEFINSIPQEEWPIFTIAKSGRDNVLKVTLSINDKPMEMELDTGASLSIVSEEEMGTYTITAIK